MIDFKNLSKLFFLILLFILLPLLSRDPLLAQNFTGDYQFYLPPNDTSSQKFLPYFPAINIFGNNFISIENNGHFSFSGKQIRFFGTNCVFGGAFPTKSKAWFIAGRLRKMGFNLIRFHHMDNPFANVSLFEYNKDTRHLNPFTLDRLDYFINELKKNGIFANINLHVSRTFNVNDGVQNADSISDYGKGVSFFDPQLIALHKEYAGQLLTHKNPYTNLPLANDPVMAMVEITNENSLYRMWRDGGLKSISSGGILIYRHVKMLDSLWINYLNSKYSSTENLKKAWSAKYITDTTNQVKDGQFGNNPLTKYWELEIHSPANANMAVDPINPYEGSSSAKIIVTNSDNTNWHIQWKQATLTIKKDSSYSVSFAAKSDKKRKISVSITQNTSPWTYFTGLDFTIDTEWKKFKFSFKSNYTCEKITRLSFNLGSETGQYWFDDIRFSGKEVSGLDENEKLENNLVRRIEFTECPNYSDQRTMDISAFYIKLQNDFYAQMYNYLKNEIGVKVPIVGTNWNVGAPDLAVQSNLDYIDNHSYWDHPQFPNIPWSSTDWKINNTPMVLSTTGGTIPGLMNGVGFYKKPFTISEYNHAFPNRFQSEGVLFLTSYASFHDVDGIMFFDYNGSSDNWETDFIDGYFDIHRNTAMLSLIPSSSYAYRNYFISTANTTYYINYNQNDFLKYAGIADNIWSNMSVYPHTLGLRYSIRNRSFDAPQPVNISFLPSAPGNPYESDTKELLWNTDGIFTTVTDKYTCVTGLLDKFRNFKAGDLNILNSNDFASLSWISLSEKKLSQSDRSLITVSSVIQNSNMVWDGVNTIHNGWGKAPTSMKKINILLKLNIEADSIKVFPLDPVGSKMIGFYTLNPVEPNTYYLNIDQNNTNTPWYGIEKYGKGITKINENITPKNFSLSNFPNPFNNSTAIKYSLPVESKLNLSIYDLLGRRVKTLVDKEKEMAGEFSIFWNGKDDYNIAIASGIYLIRFSASRYNEIKKIILIK